MHKIILAFFVNMIVMQSLFSCCFEQFNTIPSGNAYELNFSPDGSCLGVSTGGSFIVITRACSTTPTTRTVIPLIGNQFNAFSPDGSCVALTNTSSTPNSVVIVTNPCTVTAASQTIPVGPNVAGLAMSPTGSCLAVVQGFPTNQVAIILNPCTATAVDHFITGFQNAGAVAFSPDGSCLAVTNTNTNTISIIANPCTSTTVVRTIPIGNVSRNVVFSPDGSCLAASNINDGTISIINDPCNATTSRTITVGTRPQFLAFSPDGSCLAVSNQDSNSVSIINNPCTATAVSSTISIANPLGVAFSPDGSCLAVKGTPGVVIYRPISLSIVPAAASTCAGQSITFSAQPVGVGPFTYAWTGPNGFTSTQQNITLTNVQVANAGVYTVNMTNGSGCVISDTATLAVNANPVVNISPSSVTACVGTSPMLTAQVTVGSAPFTYSWSGPNGFTANTESITLSNIQTTSAGTYSVLVIDANNCRSTVSAVVTVNPTPAVTITPGAVSLCAGSSTSLTASATGTGPFSYAWSGPNSFTATTSTINLTNLQSVNAGNYTVVATGANNCSSSATASVTVNANPVVTVNPSAIAICANSAVSLNAQSTGLAPLSYAWSGPNGFAATTQEITIANAQAINAGIYTVVVTDANGCTGSGTSTLTVNPNPTAAINPVSVVICAGQSTQLTAQTTGSATYLWSGPNGFSSTDQTIVLNNLQANNAGSYSVTITDTNGCSSDATALVTVNANPIITITPDAAVICEGQSTTFTANAVGTSPFTYSWVGPDSFASTQQAITITNAQLINSGTYTVTITDGNDCSSTSNAELAVNGIPTATVEPTTVCAGSEAVLSAIVSGASTVTYAWSGPNGFTADTQTITLPNAQQINAGDYTVIVTAVGCSLTATATATITVNSLPTVNVTSSQTIITPGQSVVLTATPSGIAPFTLVWSDGFVQDAVTDVVTRTVTPEVTTQYSVVIIDANGCQSDPGTIIEIDVKSALVYSLLTAAIANKYC